MSELTEIIDIISEPKLIKLSIKPKFDIDNNCTLFEAQDDCIFYNEKRINLLKEMFIFIGNCFSVDDSSNSLQNILNKNTGLKQKAKEIKDKNISLDSSIKYVNEFELAILFLILHEIGHITLGHTKLANKPLPSELFKMEEAADEFAIKKFLSSYSNIYDYEEEQIAISILKVFLACSIFDNKEDDTHPSVDARISKLFTLLNNKPYCNNLNKLYEKYTNIKNILGF